jgi:3-phosphoshikimate 1-carboxyvinyltransferase
MKLVIKPGEVSGSLTAPPSKSIMQRVCCAAFLHNGKTIITNPGKSDDDKAALEIIQALGAKIIPENDGSISIISTGKIAATGNELNCHESGLSTRLFIPVAALSEHEIQITGSGSLMRRPMQEFEKIFKELGAGYKSSDGYLPVTTKGPLNPVSISLDGSVSSQFLSGLLFAYSATVKNPTTITVNNLKSKPYIDLTLEVLKEFGKPVENNNYEKFILDPAYFTEKEEIDYYIEGDWSSASIWLVAAAIKGNVTLSGLKNSSLQADRKIIDVLKQTGAVVNSADDLITVPSNGLLPFKFDATDCPDLFPILSVLASYCKGESEIKGLHRLVNKESDRSLSITQMLHRLGVNFNIENDNLIIKGTGEINGGEIYGFDDHRIIMAAAIAGLNSKTPITITGAMGFEKSYPSFLRDLSSLNVAYTLI